MLKSYAEKGAELLLKYTLKNYTYFYLFHILTITKPEETGWCRTEHERCSVI